MLRVDNILDTKTNYKFYKDRKMIAIILILFSIILEIGTLMNTPVIATINSYTIGVLFGRYSFFFYFYIFATSIVYILKFQKGIKIFKITKISYWVFVLCFMTMIVSWFFYAKKFPLSKGILGSGGFKHSFGLWWDQFKHSKYVWAPTTSDAGLIGALLFSIFSSFLGAIGAAILYTIFSILAFSFMITGSWIGIYVSIINYFKKQKKGFVNGDSLLNNNQLFLEIGDDYADQTNNTRKQILPFEDVSDLEKSNSFTKNTLENQKEWSISNNIWNDFYYSNNQLQFQTKWVESQIKELNKLFISFKLQGKIINRKIGPTITQLIIDSPIPTEIVNNEFNKIEENIKLILDTMQIRFVQIVNNSKKLIIEFENKYKSIVDFLNAKFNTKKFSLPIFIGMDIDNKPINIDLNNIHTILMVSQDNEHLILLNTVIASLIINKSPQDLKIIIIDNSNIDLAIFSSIPHLLSPIVNNIVDIKYTLRQTIKAINERKNTFQKYNVKTITEYNKIVNNKNLILPNIVMVINNIESLFQKTHDEEFLLLAEIMESSMNTGIQIIITTNNFANIDFLNNYLIKNTLLKIIFKMKTKINSRNFIDSTGAEKLIGSGDMLVLNPLMILKRIQSPSLSDMELQNIVGKICNFFNNNYKSDL